MPEASTQTDQVLVDAAERQFKQEAIDFLEGRNKGPPSAAMMEWLGQNLVPVAALKPMPFEDLTPEEKVQLAEMRRASVAELVRKREQGDRRKIVALRPWLR
ncbi:hypothetical protein B0H11DRAFT_2239347 [Mycena galericulata]|nr:hypothetical protein B0H11DRAFT_2239347 [Mycena galericulata]